MPPAPVRVAGEAATLDSGSAHSAPGTEAAMAELSDTVERQRVRAVALADLLSAQRGSVPLIDPAEWRGPTASAERDAANRMIELLSTAVASAIDAEEAATSAAAAVRA
jgi:hypothetical protein